MKSLNTIANITIILLLFCIPFIRIIYFLSRKFPKFYLVMPIPTVLFLSTRKPKIDVFYHSPLLLSLIISQKISLFRFLIDENVKLVSTLIDYVCI